MFPGVDLGHNVEVVGSLAFLILVFCTAVAYWELSAICRLNSFCWHSDCFNVLGTVTDFIVLFLPSWSVDDTFF